MDAHAVARDGGAVLRGTLRLPREVRFGYGTRRLVAGIVRHLGSRVFALVDPSVADLPATGELLADLRAAGCVIDLCTQVEPELPVDSVIGLGARARGADVIVGIGGGSVLDAAKLAALLAAHGGRPSDYYGEGAVAGPILPVVAVPTTAGTGSEVTPVAVVSDPGLAMKVGISSPHLVPTAAIVDPEFTLGVPASVSAFAGIDALVHCLESFTAAALVDASESVFTGRNTLSDIAALDGAAALARWLPVAVSDPANREARERVALGSLWGGVAFGSTGTHLSHALQYPIGTLTRTPHGLGTGLMLPYVLDACRADEVAERRLADAAVAMGSKAVGVAPRAADAVRIVAGVGERIGIPRTLGEIGVGAGDLQAIADAALGATRLLAISPIPATRDALLDILRRAMAGTLSEGIRS